MNWFCIFHLGGLVLFFRDFSEASDAGTDDQHTSAQPESVLRDLVRTVLLAEKAGARIAQLRKQHLVAWRTANQFQLVFAAEAPSTLELHLLEQFLECCRSSFCQTYGSLLQRRRWSTESDFDSFAETVDRARATLQLGNTRAVFAADEHAHVGAALQRGRVSSPRPAANTRSSVQTLEDSQSAVPSSLPAPTTDAPDVHAPEHAGSIKDTLADDDVPIRSNAEPLMNASIPVEAAALETSTHPSNQAKKLSRGSIQRHSARPEQRRPPKKHTKLAAGRRWDDSIPTAEELAALDLSGEASCPLGSADDVGRARAAYLETQPRASIFENLTTDEEATNNDMERDVGADGARGSGNLWRTLGRLAGSRPLTRADLEKPLQYFRDRLIARNVAPTVAEKLTQSVEASLENRTLDALTVHRMVRAAVEDALQRVLQPLHGTQDLVLAIEQHRQRASIRRPFVIVFTGVNGVGKSTTLAKIAFLLLQHNLRLLLAAGDTFRAGAIEQLRIHARCLNIPLYERGYGKDPSSVAAAAISQAEQEQRDVVLIDTAGRMQDNEPLMKALAALVQRAAPERLFFVGEALVGNEAIDQLVKFNQALLRYQQGSGGKPRLIDGIILTKFDAVDEKVGAAVTMMYTTSIPIVFVGTGQTYHDLEPVNIPKLVKALVR